MRERGKAVFKVLAVLLAACFAMFLIEHFGKPPYYLKSVMKLLVFLVLPLLLYRFDPQFSIRDCFRRPAKRQWGQAVLAGCLVYLGIIGGYFAISRWIDLSAIREQLSGSLQVDKGNFLFVAAYIAVVNSFLEEFFFRGFAFLSLQKLMRKWGAYGISAMAFALYHVSILNGWFVPVLFLLFLAGLFAAGLLFNWLDSKTENLYSSWLVHMGANLATNTIGLLLFGIIK